METLRTFSAAAIAKLVLCSAATLLFVSTDAMAANSWKYHLPVSSVVSLPDGGFILVLEAGDPACGSSGNQFYVQANLNGQTQEGVKTALAVVLTALSTGKTVNVFVDTAVAGCPVQLVQINP